MQVIRYLIYWHHIKNLICASSSSLILIMTLQSKCDLRFYRWRLWAPEERVNCPRSQSPGGCGAGPGEARALEDCRAKPPAPRFTFSLLIHPGHPPWELPNPGQEVPGYTAMTQIFTKIWLDFQVYFFCVWQKKINICIRKYLQLLVYSFQVPLKPSRSYAAG